jgi:methionyl-tRNA synthetase
LLTVTDEALLAKVDAAQAGASAAMENLAIGQALESIWSAMSDANQYFADAAPWAVRKEDPARADTILFVTLEAIRKLAIMASWAVPLGAQRMLDLLGQSADARDFTALGNRIAAGTELPAPSGVFPRLELAA